jgi:5-methylcytosine-specific restriction endonuclease McrA
MKKIKYRIIKFFGLTEFSYFKKMQYTLKEKLKIRQAKVEYLEERVEELLGLQTEHQRTIATAKKLKVWSKDIRKIGICDCCGSTENLTAHHLWPKSLHPTLALVPENGVCLCLTCHREFEDDLDISDVSPEKYKAFRETKIDSKGQI